MTNIDEDGLEGSPWYVRAFVRVGMPTAFASLLLWFLITNITGTLTTQLQNLQQMLETQQTVIQNQTRIIELLNEHANDEQRSQKLMLAMCYNATTNENEVQRCTEAFR